ncbi:MAG: hypothetical protein OXO54_05305 [Chloroflexota bacterium]|nr:hypothetical protein [Chloroflexota bacterium]MDE2897717.1 hypothetical protein [Chloroflexota bacterium]
MTPGRPADDDRVNRPFADPLDAFNEAPERKTRQQRRRAESVRRRQAQRDVDRLAAGHHTPRGRRLLIYGLITVSITLVVWRLMHWFVYFSSIRRSGGGAIMGRSGRDIIASGFESQPPPAAWIDPVGLAVGLALGLLVTWVYARYFQNL